MAGEATLEAGELCSTSWCEVGVEVVGNTGLCPQRVDSRAERRRPSLSWRTHAFKTLGDSEVLVAGLSGRR